jgi:hypothetical protein
MRKEVLIKMNDKELLQKLVYLCSLQHESYSDYRQRNIYNIVAELRGRGYLDEK